MSTKTLGDDLRPRAPWEKEPLVVTSSDTNADDVVVGTLSPEARLDEAEAELAASQAELASTKARLVDAEAKLADQGSK